MKAAIRILIVEDSEDDTTLLVRELQQGGCDPAYKRVATLAGLATALDAPDWDVVISDYQMPGFNGLDALKVVRDRWVDLPFILVSGAVSEEIAVAVMKAGANDFLNKSHLVRLAPAIERELRDAGLRRHRRQSEAALLASEERLAGLVNSAMDAIIAINGGQQIVLFNPAAERMFGCRASEAIGSALDRFIPARFCDAHREHVQQFGEMGVTHRGVRANGEEFPIEASISQVDLGPDKLYTVILRDITERAKAEAELAAWQGELERRVEERTAALKLAHQKLQAEIEERQRLEAEMTHAIEREQLRLGKELHDGLGQQLTGIAYLTKALRSKLEELSPERTKEAENLQQLLMESIERTRTLAQEFYPVDLDQQGLLEVLKQTTNCTDGPALVVQADEHAAVAELNGAAAIHLFRIAQEAVRNAVQHARASRVVVRLAVINDQITLIIMDDGVGLSSNPEAATGLGLRIMRYRSGLIGGKLEVRNDPGGGAIVTCSVPLQQHLPPPERTFRR